MKVVDKKKVLIVGQTPPPYNGQSIMIGKILEGKFEKIQLHHVRMSFSKDATEIGQANLRKVIHLIQIIANIILKKLRHNIDVLYYPPAGPNKVPFLRDAIILICTRPFFKTVCFHFHAAGISDLYPSLNQFLRFMFQKAYYYASVGIRLSLNSTQDCQKLKVKNEYIIPYGIKDIYATLPLSNHRHEIPSILFVGLLIESKGLWILIDACNKLKKKRIAFAVNIMGEFKQSEFEVQTKELISNYGLEKDINFLGVLIGDEKFNAYHETDIFCFPSFYEAESFPVVLLEASSFALPIISTFWRGIPSIVIDGENGFLVPVKDADSIAEKLEILIRDPVARQKMGTRARQLYLEKYTLEKFYQNIETALCAEYNAG